MTSPKAFVVMPFAREFDDIWTELLKPALERAGFVATRADSVLNQRNILQDVVLGIGEASLIIADLTGLNSNVMYELGLAHGLRRRVVLITQNLDEVPFDLRAYRVIEYSTRFGRSDGLVSVITEIAGNLSQLGFGSPVTDFWNPDLHAIGAQGEAELSLAARSVAPADVEAAMALTEASMRTLLSLATTAVEPIGTDTATLVGLATVLQPDEPPVGKPGLFRRRARENDVAVAEREMASWITALGARLEEYLADMTRELEKIAHGVSTIAFADRLDFPSAVVTLNRWRISVPDQLERIGKAETSLRRFAMGCESLGADYPLIRRASDRAGVPLWAMVDRYVSAQAQLSRLESLLETKPAPAAGQ